MNADEIKKADEIVRALKECGNCDTCPYYDCWIDEHTGGLADACDEGRLFRDVIALIESLQAQLTTTQKRLEAAEKDITALGNESCESCKLCRKCPCCKPGERGVCKGFEWRGPQDAGKGEAEHV